MTEMDVVQHKQIVGCSSYKNGRRIAELDVQNPEEMEIAPGQVIWVGLYEPDITILQRLQIYFKLHDLAIEDAYKAHQRAKLEVYNADFFMVLKTAKWIDERVQIGETSIFAGPGYIVTSRRGPSQGYSHVRKRCEGLPHELKHGEDFILYALMDFIVDGYFPILDKIEDQVEQVEEQVFGEQSEKHVLERVYNLRHDLLELRHAIAPVADICNRLIRNDISIINKEGHHYFRDIQDHSMTLLERVDSLRELLKSVLESKMLLVSMRQNDVTRKLAAWAAMLAVPTAIAGFYGMNFDYMPELRWQYGYFSVMGLVFAICSFLFWRFKKSGWL